MVTYDEPFPNSNPEYTNKMSNDEYFYGASEGSTHGLAPSSDSSRSAFNPNTFMHFNLKPAMVNTQSTEEEIKLSDYIIEDVPLLMSDDDDLSEDEGKLKAKTDPAKDKSVSVKPSDTAEEVKRSMKYEVEAQANVNEEESAVGSPMMNNECSPVLTAATTPANSFSEPISKPKMKKLVKTSKKIESLTKAQFQFEKKQLMTIVVKYISTKIVNSFPPENPRNIKSDELPLDKFLLILVSRLQLSISNFMKGVIYLFRYMDIIYLLRYLNQSNNFANYNEMDFELKKLIVGCFKLTLIRERVSKNWNQVTGLSNNEINRVVKTIVGRLNGKLLIKDIELVKLKLEIFRFVKMVTNRI